MLCSMQSHLCETTHLVLATTGTFNEDSSSIPVVSTFLCASSKASLYKSTFFSTSAAEIELLTGFRGLPLPSLGPSKESSSNSFFVCFQIGDNQRRHNTPQLYMRVRVNTCILFLVLHPG